MTAVVCLQTYVQDMLKLNGTYLSELLLTGHVYVCGNATMAAEVYSTLAVLIQKQTRNKKSNRKDYLQAMKVGS